MRRTRERTKNIPRLVLSFFYCLLLYFSVVVNERIAWIELCILFQSYSALVSLSSTLRFVSVLPVHRLLRGPLHHLRTRPNPGGVRRRRNRKHHPLPGLLFLSLIFREKARNNILFYRCNCLLPCSRKLLKIQTWRSDPNTGTNSDQKTEPEKEPKNKFGYAFFQVITYTS